MLIFDEAHHLRNEALEDLRLLTNFAMDSEPRLCLLLIGLTELRKRLCMRLHQSLSQRLVIRHQFGALSRTETERYLQHRLQNAGAADKVQLFEANTIEMMHAQARGMPRQINRRPKQNPCGHLGTHDSSHRGITGLIQPILQLDANADPAATPNTTSPSKVKTPSTKSLRFNPHRQLQTFNKLLDQCQQSNCFVPNQLEKFVSIYSGFQHWLSLQVTHRGKVVYHNDFITSLPLNPDTVETIAQAGRSRWRIENENFNTLKPRGYNLQHNFGHGKLGLANTRFQLNLLAFAFHTISDLLCTPWQQARKSWVARYQFFENLRAISRLYYFDHWNTLLKSVDQSRAPPS